MKAAYNSLAVLTNPEAETVNIQDELNLATDNNRQAYARLITHADSVISFIASVAENESRDIEYFQRLAQHIMNTISK